MRHCLVKSTPNTHTFAFDQPTTDEANSNHEAQCVEKADGPAHLNDGVQLGDGGHYEQQKQEKRKTAVSKTSESTPKLAIGGDNDQVVSMDETAKQLSQEDPWMSRRLGSNAAGGGAPVEEESSGDVVVHDGTDDNVDEE